MSNYWGKEKRLYSHKLRGYFIEGLMENELAQKNKYVHPIQDRGFWDNVPETVKKKYISLAENYLDYQWQSRRVSDFLDYFRPGDKKAKGEDLMFEKRRAVYFLTLAEALEHKGRFLDQILNGVFSICEESTWGVAGHFHACGAVCNVSAEGVDPIPSEQDQVLDLRAGEAAVLMAFVYGTMQSEFAKISPRIEERILNEVEKRIFTPFLTRNDTWWLEFTTDLSIWSAVSNWTTVMNGDIIYAATVLLKDEARIKQILLRAMTSLDIYVDMYADDGFCEEGRSYWFAGPYDLFVAMNMFDYLCGGNTGVFQDEKLKVMLDYILHVNIAGNHYVGFADSTPISQPELEVNTFEHIGRAINDTNFLNTAAFLRKSCEKTMFIPELRLREIAAFFDVESIVSEPTDTTLEENRQKHMWFSDNQVMIARESENKQQGFFLSVKGGNNLESHNHNDIGNLIVYCNGEPVIVDVGCGEYTKNLFNEHRYEIWFIQSQYHNVPMFGGVGQKDGNQYCAENVRYKKDSDNVSLSMDLQKAYNDVAGLNSFKRNIEMKDGEISVCDSYELKNKTEVTEVFITPQKATVTNNTVEFSQCVLTFDSDCTVTTEPISEKDPHIREVWGENLTRILITRNNTQQGSFTMKITKK